MKEFSSEGAESDDLRVETLGLSEVDTLPHRLGFVETPELLDIHHEIVSAVARGDIDGRIAALNRYLDGGEELASISGDAGPQIGLIVSQALIWREANEPVRAIRAMLQAKEYAENMDLGDIGDVIGVELDVYAGSGEELQARDEFDAAIERYIELEQTELTDHDRGILNLRLAECYQGLLDADSELEEAIWLTELRDASLASAMTYLEGQPEQVKVRAYLDSLTA